MMSAYRLPHATFLSSILIAATLQCAVASESLKKTTKSGVPVGIFGIGQIDPITCTTDKNAVLQPNVSQAPQHGTIEQRVVKMTFNSISGRHVCNGRPYQGIGLFYTSAKGYRGPDRVEIQKTVFYGRMESTEKLVYEIDVQ